MQKGGPIYAARDPRGRDAERTAHLRDKFGISPAWWATRTGGVGELACRVLQLLASYADPKGRAYPAIGTLAAQLHVTERRVKAALATLEDAGLLTRTPRPRASNLYTLVREAPPTITTYAAQKRASRVLETITPVPPRKRASRVTESGHYGCRIPGTVTDHEQTNTINTGERELREPKKRSRPPGSALLAVDDRDGEQGAVTVQAILRRALELDLEIFIRDEDGITVRGRAAAIEQLRPHLVAHKREIIAALRDPVAGMTAADAVRAAQQLLRSGHWPPVPAVCPFFTGPAGAAACQRCGASWIEHFT